MPLPTLLQRARKLITCDSSLAELLSTVPAIIWGIVLLGPACEICRNPVLQRMPWITETEWSIVFLLYVAASIYGWYVQSYAWRRASMFFGIWLWVSIGVIRITGNPLGVGYINLVHALSAALAYIQLTVDQTTSLRLSTRYDDCD